VETDGSPLLSLEYYQPIFSYLGEVYGDRIQRALHVKPVELRRKHFLNQLPTGEVLSKEAAWQPCRSYLGIIEENIATILRRHSIFFWIHLYRRIGVQLSPKHEDKTDANTLGLVRGIVDLAIAKHGDPARTTDVALSSTIKPPQVLGGHFQRIFAKLNVDVAAYFKQLAASGQWVLTEFEQRDYFDIFFVEGLAYEYWRTTALMRSVGKGTSICYRGDAWPERIETRELTKLIISYDERIDRMPFTTGLIGSWFQPDFDATATDNQMPIPTYNIDRRDGLGVLRALGFGALPGTSFISNFLIVHINISSFRAAHEFAADAFQAVTGTTLDALLTCLWGLSNIALLPARILVEERQPGDPLHGPLGKNLLNIIQRGYTLVGLEGDSLVDEIMFRAQHLGFSLPPSAPTDIATAIAYLTISKELQEQVALWSGGRRFVLIPYGNMFVVDLEAVPSVLNGMFFRVPYAQGRRGSVFETAFRSALAAEGFVSPQTGEVRAADGSAREIDASARVGDCLFLFECRTIERPLDFEIGRISTLTRRQQFLDQKIDQALSLREFVLKNPVGRNYDFRWAKSVEVFVVSPFVEWIWDLGERLWRDATTPRILQADEAIAYLHERSAGN
jgi:hypothetical protein